LIFLKAAMDKYRRVEKQKSQEEEIKEMRSELPPKER